MNQTIRIGTRESKLALWQAEWVSDQLKAAGYSTELVFIKSEGDINLTTPLYELGVQGIFTRMLDIALLDGRIDIAVHSYKDVPTIPANGLGVCAVLKRGNVKDMLIHKDGFDPDEYKSESPVFIATSSIRRKAQWLNRFPDSVIENLRGNVNTRIKKLHEANWHGAIFAAAGIERLGLSVEETGPRLILDWMLPAPAQGAVSVVCRNEDTRIKEACAGLNDPDTEMCTKVERDFLRLLQGGCSTPISAYAEIKDGQFLFKGNVSATDGSRSITIVIEEKPERFASVAGEAVKQAVEKGADKLLVK